MKIARPGCFDALGHAVERGEAAGVADEEVPVSGRIEGDLAARPHEVDLVTGFGSARPARYRPLRGP